MSRASIPLALWLRRQFWVDTRQNPPVSTWVRPQVDDADRSYMGPPVQSAQPSSYPSGQQYASPSYQSSAPPSYGQPAYTSQPSQQSYAPPQPYQQQPQQSYAPPQPQQPSGQPHSNNTAMYAAGGAAAAAAAFGLCVIAGSDSADHAQVRVVRSVRLQRV